MSVAAQARQWAPAHPSRVKLRSRWQALRRGELAPGSWAPRLRCNSLLKEAALEANRALIAIVRAPSRRVVAAVAALGEVAFDVMPARIPLEFKARR